VVAPRSAAHVEIVIAITITQETMVGLRVVTFVDAMKED
jgi:hypothetical protein